MQVQVRVNVVTNRAEVVQLIADDFEGERILGMFKDALLSDCTLFTVERKGVPVGCFKIGQKVMEDDGNDFGETAGL